MQKRYHKKKSVERKGRSYNKYDNSWPANYVCALPNNDTIDLNKGYHNCIWYFLDTQNEQYEYLQINLKQTFKAVKP